MHHDDSGGGFGFDSTKHLGRGDLRFAGDAAGSEKQYCKCVQVLQPLRFPASQERFFDKGVQSQPPLITTSFLPQSRPVRQRKN